MQPGTQRAFRAEMTAALTGKQQVAGQVLQVIGFEEFLTPDHDALRCQFWLGTKQAESATYTFTFTSDLSIAENLDELEDFVRERFGVATRPPVSQSA